MASHFLNTLEKIIEERQTSPQSGSYVSSLFSDGQDRILKKIGEEAGEVIIASKNKTPQEIKHEAADLVFHLLILLRYHQLTFNDIVTTLESRQK